MLMAAAFVALQAACQQAPEEEMAQDSPQDATDMAPAAPPPAPEAMTQAESDYQVALRRCEMLAMEQQNSCREEAQSALDAARRAAEGPTGPS